VRKAFEKTRRQDKLPFIKKRSDIQYEVG